MRKRTHNDRPKKEEDVILLEDLAPRKDVKGGAGKVLFGQARATKGGKSRDRGQRKGEGKPRG